jgi:hypothetical protein
VLLLSCFICLNVYASSDTQNKEFPISPEAKELLDRLKGFKTFSSGFVFSSQKIARDENEEDWRTEFSEAKDWEEYMLYKAKDALKIKNTEWEKAYAIGVVYHEHPDKWRMKVIIINDTDKAIDDATEGGEELAIGQRRWVKSLASQKFEEVITDPVNGFCWIPSPLEMFIMTFGMGYEKQADLHISYVVKKSDNFFWLVVQSNELHPNNESVVKEILKFGFDTSKRLQRMEMTDESNKYVLEFLNPKIDNILFDGLFSQP